MKNETRNKLPSANQLTILDALHTGCKRYGLEIVEVTGLKWGSVYPTLHHMEQELGYLTAWDEKEPGESGIARRYYRITGVGLRARNAAHAAAQAVAEEFARPLPPVPVPAGGAD
jgi:DNA-binding PadR family transcriptional regulator